MTIADTFADHAAVTARAALELPPVLEQIVATLHKCLRGGGKILACGNGGSAADAQHLAAELVGRFRDERHALAAIALTADTATLTALSNDYGFERVFARQVEALARPGDLLVLHSTSGESPNVVRAAQAARARGVEIVAFLGKSGGQLRELADIALVVPSDDTARIQELHLAIEHIICAWIEERFAG